ncbi:trace amine-associated receptor 1-like [Haliotis rufescens]|uniref:trace amine-associated receptor 1-like n=1 Tax=Haliotis rufescens TaxID=6454 RepID=UPI00201F500F|nr:trace amine-associated receptor 1-like [Haliotis rufescens]
MADPDVNSTNHVIGSSEDTTVLGWTYLVVGILVISANSVVVFVVVRTRELHMPTLWVIAFMGVCDFFMGCLVLVFYMPSAFSRRFVYSDVMKNVSFCIHMFLLGQTTFNIALAELDRYIAIEWPLKYMNIVTTKRFMAAVVLTVILGVCRIGLITSTGIDTEYDPHLAMSLPAFTNSISGIGSRMAGVLVLPLSTFGVIVFCFLKIVSNVNLRRRLKISLMALLPACVFCVSYVPVFVCIIQLIIGVKEEDISGWLKFGVVAIFSNSLWNVLIYTVSYRPFREALTSIFCHSYYRWNRRMDVLRTYGTREASSQNISTCTE